MKKFKKLTSLFIALTLVILMAALSVGNSSAVVDENGYYVPKQGSQPTDITLQCRIIGATNLPILPACIFFLTLLSMALLRVKDR